MAILLYDIRTVSGIAVGFHGLKHRGGDAWSRNSGSVVRLYLYGMNYKKTEEKRREKMKKSLWLVLLVLLSVMALTLSSCGEAELGTEKNPLIWSFVPSGEMQDVVAGAEGAIALIEEETGLVIEANVATEYAGVIEAMCSDPVEAHMGSLATFAYVLAAKKGCAEAALVSVRFGSPVYNGQIIVREDSGITELSQLAGKTFCRPDPLSTSGWIIPSLDLQAAGVDTDNDLDVLDAGSHDAVVAAVYDGECDAGATYVDARGSIEDDHPDVKEVISIIQTSVDIPNDGLQFAPSIPQELRDKIVDAMVKIMETEEGQEAMDSAYEWAGVERHGDEFYDSFRQLLDAAGVDIEAMQE
jgi:phosphonate transport system substrate-binding protein